MLEAAPTGSTPSFLCDMEIVDDANRRLTPMNESRLAEMQYLLTTETKHLMAQQERFEKLASLAERAQNSRQGPS